MQILFECQEDLGLRVSLFPDIGRSTLVSYSLRAAQIVQRNKSNNDYNHSGNHNQEQVTEEVTVNMNKKDSLMHIVKILEMIIIKRIDLLESLAPARCKSNNTIRDGRINVYLPINTN
jgi:hypothetical protein